MCAHMQKSILNDKEAIVEKEEAPCHLGAKVEQWVLKAGDTSSMLKGAK